MTSPDITHTPGPGLALVDTTTVDTAQAAARRGATTAAFSNFSHPVRVYWEDTDAGGVVFYANYLKFFERARTEWLRGQGFSQQRMVEETGVVFVVTQTNVRYHRPSRLDDELRVTVHRAEVSRARMVVEQEAWRGSELLCEGNIHLACVQQGTFRPCRIPTAIFDRITSPDHTRP